jgi:hypothetical protein
VATNLISEQCRLIASEQFLRPYKNVSIFLNEAEQIIFKSTDDK